MQLDNIVIRAALPADASQWANMLLKLDSEVEYTTFLPGERSDEIRKYEEKILTTAKYPKSKIFFALNNELEDNQIVGYLSIEAYRNDRKSHVATVGIGILKSHYSKGIANQLCAELIKHAVKHELKRIEGHIAKSNYKSISLAKKFGFVIEGVKKEAIRINGSYEDEYLMVLAVESLTS